MAYNPELSPRQYEALQALELDGVREVLYGGAKGGGKSVFGCIWALKYSLEIIARYALSVSEDPLRIGFLGRKQSVDFTKTTLETWRRFIPRSIGGQKLWEIRQQAREIVILDRVKWDYGGFGRSEDIQKFNSAEYAAYFLDQAEELSRDDISLVRGATGRLVIRGETLPTKGLLTANPRQCWLKDEFIGNAARERRFVRALPADNPFIDVDSYVTMLEDAFRHRPDLVEAYIHGSWDDIAEEGQVILDRWIEAAGSIEFHESTVRRVLSCDVARFGNDETVIYAFENTRIVYAEVYGQKPTTHTSSRLAILARRFPGCLVVVDEVGVGAGVVDEARELGLNVMGVNGAAKARDSRRYGNLRAEIWDTAARMLADSEVELAGPMDPALRGQLLAPTYEFRRGKQYVEAKEKIKARLDQSPDKADTYVQGLWALQFAEPQGPEAKSDFKSRRQRPASSPMAM